MFLAAQTAEIAANHAIYTVSFAGACCWLLLIWFSEPLRDWQKTWLPGGNKTVIALLLVIIGISAALLH